MKALVMDSDVVRGLLKRALLRMGLDSVEAHNIGDILRALSGADDIGIAIIDNEDGEVQIMEVCKAIKKYRPYMRIIISSEDMPDMEKKAFERIGVSAFLRKPYLVANVREALSKVFENFNIHDYD